MAWNGIDDRVAWLRHDEGDVAVALRSVLADRGVRINGAALADLTTMGGRLAAGDPSEAHHVVVVDEHDRAWVGVLVRSAEGASLRTWDQVPSVARPPLEVAADLARLRADRYRSPEVRDVVYHAPIQEARAFLAAEVAAVAPPEG